MTGSKNNLTINWLNLKFQNKYKFKTMVTSIIEPENVKTRNYKKGVKYFRKKNDFGRKSLKKS